VALAILADACFRMAPGARDFSPDFLTHSIKTPRTFAPNPASSSPFLVAGVGSFKHPPPWEITSFLCVGFEIWEVGISGGGEERTTMDRPLTAAVGGVMSEPGVEGVLVASMPSGMAVASAGIAPPHAAGFIASLASRAHSLDPKGARPTVVIDTANDMSVAPPHHLLHLFVAGPIELKVHGMPAKVTSLAVMRSSP